MSKLKVPETARDCGGLGTMLYPARMRADSYYNPLWGKMRIRDFRFAQLRSPLRKIVSENAARNNFFWDLYYIREPWGPFIYP